MAGRFKHRIESPLHVFPNPAAPRGDHHAAPNIENFSHFRRADDLLIPFGENLHHAVA